MNKKGFTLVELLTVVAVISILIGILMPALNSSRIRAQRAEVKVTVKQLSQALKAYETDEGVFPPHGEGASEGTIYTYWDEALINYLDGDTATSAAGGGGSATQYFEFQEEFIEGSTYVDVFGEKIWYRNFHGLGLTTKTIDSNNPLHPWTNCILFRGVQLYSKANYEGSTLDSAYEDPASLGKKEETFRWITNYSR